MKIEIVPYLPIHGYDILERKIKEENLQLSKFPDWDEAIEGWATTGPAWTLIIDGIIIGCAGVTILQWKKGEAWTLLSKLFLKYKKTTFRAIKEGLEKVIKENNLRRVQSIIFDDNAKEICGRFLEHLGFKWECRMEKYGPNGENVHQYVRFE
jgi:hypothetical protein